MKYLRYKFFQVKKTEEFSSFIIRFILGSVASIFGGIGIYFEILQLPVNIYIGISSSFFLFTFFIFIDLFHHLESARRRYLTLLLDISYTSLSIYVTAGDAQVLWLFYIWLYIGYGSRYGENYLFAAQKITLFQYALVLYFSDLWLSNMLDITTHLLILLTLPYYIHSMIKRLHIAKTEAQKVAKLKSNFLASMSHEIRTPLNGIVGTSLLLSNTPLNSIQRKYTKALVYSSEMLLNIINDILDFAKIDANKIEINQENIDIQRCIEKITQSLLFSAEQKNLLLKTQIAADIPKNLQGDKKRLSQILLNLVGNAIKFTPKGQVEITVSVFKNTELNCTLLFKVCDTGIGISSEDQKIIFQRFTQVGETPSIAASTPGTGLGTTISKELIELLGGEIKLQSELGKGSEFSFAIRFNKTKDKNSTDKQNHINTSVNNKQRPLNILIAEDDDINAMIMEQFLSDQSHTTKRVSNGKAALEQLKITEYDIIFMDLHMPELSGLKVTEEIRKFDLQTLIIGLTANATTEQKQLCLDAGMNDFLTKPITPAALYQAISIAISGSGRQSR
ncbi:MAG: response regulator [Pseudomonadota bacterium]